MHSSVDELEWGELTETDRVLWTTFQALDPSLSSPYFSYGYYDAVEAARPGIRVLRFFVDGRPAAYWPFRKGPFGTARPVAGSLDDLHGIIAHQSVALELDQVAVRKHLGGYAFSAVPYQQSRHGIRGQTGHGNQVMDLSQGFKAWCATRGADSANFRRQWRKSQTLLADPAVEVRHDSIDMCSFDRMVELKREAYARAGHFDLFQLPWPRQLLLNLMKSSDLNARGMLSTLSIGGTVAAMAYCMRSASVLHYWFPSYEPRFAKQQPGLALLFSLAEWAEGAPIREIHLGLGDTQYKRHMASWMMPVRAGALALSPAQHVATRFTEWGARLEGRNRLLNVPAKYARKYERMALSGDWRA